MRIKVSDIEVVYNPRSEIKVDKAMIESVRQLGLIHPLVVAEYNGKYKLLDGERRYNAVKKLKHDEVDVIVHNYDEEQQKAIPIVTDIFKELLPLGDKAVGILNLVCKEKKYTEKGIAQSLGMSVKRVKRLMAIGSGLHGLLLGKLNKHEITEAQAYWIATSVKNEAIQVKLFKVLHENVDMEQALQQVAHVVDFDDVFLYERIKKDKSLGCIYEDDWGEHCFVYDKGIFDKAKADYEEKQKKEYAKAEKKRSAEKVKEQEVKEAEPKKDYKKLRKKQAETWEVFYDVMPKYLTSKTQAYEVQQLITRFALKIPTDLCKMIMKAWKVEFKAKDMMSDDYKKEVVKIISQYVKTEGQLAKLILFVDMCQYGTACTLFDMSGVKKLIVKMNKEVASD